LCARAASTDQSGHQRACLASAAVVADVVVVDGAYNWSGIYVGAQVGYAVGGNADYVYDDDDDSDYNYSHDLDGLLGGIYAGYNHQFSNNIVLGVEGDAEWSDVDGEGATPDSDPYSASSSIKWTGSARVRLGYAIDRFLPYVTGGVAVGGLSFTEFNNGDFYSEDDDVNLVGWTLGVGSEYAVTDNWIMRAKYRYTKFSDEDFTTQPEDEDYNADADIHDISIGIAYKF
jgi:outer membrane immunogenic protein